MTRSATAIGMGVFACLGAVAQTVYTIDVSKSGNIDYLMKSKTDHPACENQIEELFDPASPNALTGLAHVPQRVAAHSYWTTAPNRTLRDKRVALREKLKERGLAYWQTELCVMGNDKEIGGGGGRDLTMRTALYVAC